MMHRRSKIKVIMNFLFTFLLTLLLITFNVFAGISVGLINPKSITIAMNDSNYYKSLHKALLSSSESMVKDAGLPTSVLTDVITAQRVYIGGKNYVEQVLRGETPEIKTEKLRNQLASNINQYLQQENIQQSENLTADITELIIAIEKEYTEAISLKLVNIMVDYTNQYKDFLHIILPIDIVLISVLCYFMIRMHKYRHRGIRYIACAILSASLITLITAFYLLIKRKYAGIEVSPDYYKDFLQALIKWDMMIYIYIGGIGLTLSIGLIALVTYLKNGIKNN